VVTGQGTLTGAGQPDGHLLPGRRQPQYLEWPSRGGPLAVGRTIWWDALRAYLNGGDRDVAVNAVTTRYLDLVRDYLTARLFDRSSRDALDDVTVQHKSKHAWDGRG
jgi:hypothetical protein